jgi:hypothetical protein
MGADGNLQAETFTILAEDTENFDALFLVTSTPPKRGRFVQRLYEAGF